MSETPSQKLWGRCPIPVIGKAHLDIQCDDYEIEIVNAWEEPKGKLNLKVECKEKLVKNLNK